MATEITMPKLSDTMTEGRFLSWKKSVGERVERGDIIAEVETDKATMELEAFTAGTLIEARAKAGETVAVGTVLGLIGEPGEAAAPAGEPPVAQPVWQPSTTEVEPVPERVMAVAEPPAAPLPSGAGGEEGTRAAPLVRRLAREQGVDLQLVHGSGPDGRVLQEDLERYLHEERGGGEPEPSAGTPAASAAPGEEGGEPLTRMRSAIVKTVSESWRNIPHFYVTIEIEMTEAREIIRELKGSGSAVSANDLVIKAAAMALGKFPRLNASFIAERIVLHPEINIGFAVAVEDGLRVPVVKGCQGLTLKEIAGQTLRLIERAQRGTISQEEISGGTFSTSNLGMYGVEEFAAVIMPPQAAILAVGAIAERPVARQGQLVVARTMKATVSCDHRVVDGVDAARFLGELKRILENPVLMLV